MADNKSQVANQTKLASSPSNVSNGTKAQPSASIKPAQSQPASSSVEPKVDIKTETTPDGKTITIKTVYYPGVNGQPGRRVITRTVSSKSTNKTTTVKSSTNTTTTSTNNKVVTNGSATAAPKAAPAPESEKKSKAPKPPKNESDNKFVRFFKNKVTLFVILGIIMAASMFFLLLADKENYIRSKLGIPAVDFFVTIGKMFAMGQPFNVDITSWLILIGFWFLVFAIFGMFFVKDVFKKAYANKRGIDIEKADKKVFRKFNAVYFIIFTLLIGGCVAALFLTFPLDKMMQGLQHATEPLVNVFKSTGLFIILLLIIPACIALLILVFKLIIFLLSLIIGNVSKNVMASSNYQEAYSASQLAAAKIKQEVEEEAKRKEEEAKKAAAEEEAKKNAKKVANSEGTVGGGTAAGLAAAAAGGLGNTTLGGHQKNMFPALTKIDQSLGRKKNTTSESTGSKGKGKSSNGSSTSDKVDLVRLVNGFQSYLANRKNLYYDLNMLRGFVGGLACSRLLLLQGLSGTGKSTLPREFAEYTDNSATFYPVQATWRDKSDLVGYFSDFTGEYKETELLKTLYKAAYTPKTLYLLVLDEANISRMEYYFADFLSLYEYPSENWLVSLIQPRKDDKLPAKLEEGKVRVPVNTWFVATVNIDDSTFTISDKVYDRAMVLDFNSLNEPIKTKYDDKPYHITKAQFDEAVKRAQATTKNCLTPAEKAKFMKLIYFVGDTFDVKIGNRIMNQITNFVPVFVACGGMKDSALDVMFANKVLRKVDSLFESYVEDGLTRLNKLVLTTYGAKNFPLTIKTIAKLKKKFN